MRMLVGGSSNTDSGRRTPVFVDGVKRPFNGIAAHLIHGRLRR